MIYNWTNITSPADFMRMANEVSGGYFWLAMLFLVFFVLLILFAMAGFEVAILGASVICLILGLFLVYANLISWTWCLVFVGLIIFTFLYIMYSRKD